jgi:dynein heavy chain, axonemal
VKLKQFKETSDIIIVYEVEELTAKLDEAMATVSNLLSNRYIAQLRDRAEKLNNDILLAQELIEKLVECQKKWVYLENIFAAQDIKKQLMVEAGYFQQADKYLKNLTKKASAKPLITRLLKNTNLNDLTKNLELLEEIEKKLEDYL